MATDAQHRLVRQASRALGAAGLAHAYGHCSVRLDAEHFLVAPAKPLGLVIPADQCEQVPINGAFPSHLLGEVRIHREIYRRRADVNGIVRSMPPNVMTLAAHGISPQPRHGFGSYFYPQPELWNDPQLLRSDAAAAALSEQLGAGSAIMMRGNGCVTVGTSLEEAVVLNWYLEDMARVEIAGRMAALSANPLSQVDCEARAIWAGGILDRMWSYLTRDDPENTPSC